MALDSLPSDLLTDGHIFTNIRRVENSHPCNQDQAIIYYADKDKVPVIIRSHYNDHDEFSFNKSRNPASLYILSGLEKFSYNETNYYVYEYHTSLFDWMQNLPNVVQDGSYTRPFLQILRDAFRGLQSLYRSKQFHGRFGVHSIAVVKNVETGASRGKLMNMMDWGEQRDDCGTAATMIQQEILSEFNVNKTQRKEMKYLYRFFDHFARTSSNLDYCWYPIQDYPIFLNLNVKTMIRKSAKSAYLATSHQMRSLLRNHLQSKKENFDWRGSITNEDLLDTLKNQHGTYSDDGCSFMIFGRNAIEHVPEGGNMSMEDVDSLLEKIRPAFVAKIFNAFHFLGIYLKNDVETL